MKFLDNLIIISSLISCLCLTVSAISDDCQIIYDYSTDESLNQHLIDNQIVISNPECFKELLDMNYFNTTKNQIQKVELEKLPVVLDYMRQGMVLVNERMEARQAYVTKQKDYLIVETPVQWAQSLNHVFVELRYAHRHDAPGCSNADDEQIELTEDTLSLSVLCMEVNTKVKYMIKINLWDKIDVNKSSYEYQAVGRQHFTLAKLNAPARWRTLYQEVNETQQALDKITRFSGKPFQIRLWLQRHEKHVQQLWEFEGDAIDDYEGHQWMEEKNEEYEEYVHKKSLSKKGPIPLKKKKKSKGKKSKK